MYDVLERGAFCLLTWRGVLYLPNKGGRLKACVMVILLKVLQRRRRLGPPDGDAEFNIASVGVNC